MSLYRSESLLKRFVPSILLLAVATLSACATTQHLAIIEREQGRIRAETANVRTENAAMRKEFDSIRTTLADTRAALQEIQRELSALREKVGEVRHQADRQMDRSTREGDQRIKDLEGRVSKLDSELKSQGALLKAREEESRTLRDLLRRATQGSKEAVTAGGAEAASELAREKAPQGGESDAVRKDYEEALKLVERKDYRGAINRFKNFLKRHSKSEYADNAQYWIGECYYALKEFDQAILEFDAVRRRYPNGDKVPAALLKLGYAFAELGDKVDARLILQELVDRFPQSEETVKAKQKLKALES